MRETKPIKFKGRKAWMATVDPQDLQVGDVVVERWDELCSDWDLRDSQSNTGEYMKARRIKSIQHDPEYGSADVQLKAGWLSSKWIVVPYRMEYPFIEHGIAVLVEGD